jgi:putative FmdB family regulatory protein
MSPVYEYKCITCDHITEQMRSVERMNKFAVCEKCGHPAKFKQSVPVGYKEMAGSKMQKKLNRKEKR